MSYTEGTKREFIEFMKSRTKKFAVDTIHFCDTLTGSRSCRTITFQLIKSSTSTGANYRAACRGRSKANL